MSNSNNPPYAELQLSEAQYRFLLKNIRSNLNIGLVTLQTLNPNVRPVERGLAERLVGLMEQFKDIRTILRAARPDHKEADDE